MQQDIATRIERETIVGAFDSPVRAEECLAALHAAGFAENRVGFAGPRGEVVDGDQHPYAEGALTGAATGSLTGAAVGGVLGALVAGLIPGIGPIIAGGVLAGIVAGAPTGAAIGGLAGALRNAGIAEHEAGYYEEQVRGWRSIVTVRGSNRQMEAERLIIQFGGRTEGPISEAVTRTTGTLPADTTYEREMSHVDPTTGEIRTRI